LPKVVIQEAQLSDEVELQAEPGRIVIRSVKRPREGWAEAARSMRERNEDVLIDAATATRFDEQEWKWR
jgi:antitoxin MazE